MTIITSVISNHGLIQASDSHVTREGSATATSDSKVFHLGFTPAALALAVTYRVGNERMNAWMPQCIGAHANEDGPSLEGFAQHLKTRLDQDSHEDGVRVAI